MHPLQLLSRSAQTRINSAIPKIPLYFTASPVSATSILLEWTDQSFNETGFEIHHSTTDPDSGFGLVNTTAVGATSYSHTGLTEGTVHYYKIRAINANGESEYATADAITQIPAPSNLTATAFSDVRIDLAWDDNSSSETGFEIQRSTESGSGFTTIHTTAAGVESYSNTGLTANTTYYYRIQALGTLVNSAYSNEGSAATLPAMVVPSDLVATAVSSTQINLEWSDNSTTETGFQIERSTTSGSGFSLIHTTAADVETYSDTGRTASTTYYYRIRAINLSGNTAYTAEASATTTSGAVPLAPTNLTVSLNINPTATTGGGTLSWTDNSSNETGFQIERSPDSNTSFALIHTTAAGVNSYDDTGLDRGRRYYYRVRAVNGSGNSSYTNQANDLTVWGTPISLVSQSTAVASIATPTNVTLPSGPAPTTGQMMIMIIGTKTQQVRPLPPTGWAEGCSYIDNTNGNGGDVGPIRISIFFRIATSSSETTPVPVTFFNTVNSIYAKVLVCRKDADAFWSIDFIGGAHNTVATPNYSAVSWENLTLNKGDSVLVVSAINTDGITWQDQALSHPYATFTENIEEIFDSGTSSGNDQAMTASMYTVNNNSASTGGKATFTMLGNTSTSSAPVGVTAFIRLRNARTTSTSITNPPLRVWRGADVVDTVAGVDGTTVFDGLRVSSFGPDPGTTKYSVATFNGRPCMKLVVDFTTGINYRTELHENPNQPNYPIGTQLIHEMKVETDATATQSNGEWLLMQIHPGTAPGFSSNSPQFQIAFTFNGQSGFDNIGGSSTGGELEVINSVDDPDIANTAGNPVQYVRNKYSGYNWAPSSVWRIRVHIRADIKTGDPVSKVWASKNGSAFTLLYEDYVNPTVFLTDAEAGSMPLVLGTPKFGVYEHSTKTEAARAAQVAAGHLGITLYIPCVKQIIMLPGDANYFTDWTNNSASIYNLVDTSTE